MTNPAAALLSRFATSRPVCSVEPPGLGKSPLRLDKCSHLISCAACGVAKTSAAKAYDKSAAVSPPFFVRSDQIFTIASLPMAVQPFSALRVSKKSLREIVYGYIIAPNPRQPSGKNEYRGVIMHRQNSHKRAPVAYGSPPCPSVQIYASHSTSGWYQRSRGFSIREFGSRVQCFRKEILTFWTVSIYRFNGEISGVAGEA